MANAFKFTHDLQRILTELIPAMYILAPYLEVQLWPAQQPSAHEMYIYWVCPQRHVTLLRAIFLRLALIQPLYQLPASACMHSPLPQQVQVSSRHISALAVPQMLAETLSI